MSTRATALGALIMTLALSGCVSDGDKDPPFRELFSVDGAKDRCLGAGRAEVSRSFSSEPDNELRLTYRLRAETGTVRITIDAPQDNKDPYELARATNGDAEGTTTAGTANSGGWRLQVDCPVGPALGLEWDILVEGRDGGYRAPTPGSPGLLP